MNRNLTAQAASLALSLLVTVCTLVALDGLAQSGHENAQHQAAATAPARG